MAERNNTLFTLGADERKKSIEKIIESSCPNRDFFLMIAASSIITALGILIDSIVVVIGGMLVAPMLSPLLALALGVEIADFKLIRRTSWAIVKAVTVVVFVALIISLFMPLDIENNKVLDGLSPSLAFGGIALVSGVAAAFALAKPDMSESLPGVAVSVTLIPPLSAIGVGLSHFQWPLIRDALQMFAINIVAIVAAGVVVFSLMKFYMQRGQASKELKEEEKILKNGKEKKTEEPEEPSLD